MVYNKPLVLLFFGTMLFSQPLFITDSIIGNTNDHIAPVFFFTGFLYNITGYPASCICILYCIAYNIKTDF